MALGYNLVILPPTSYDFSSMQASSRQCIILARRIDTTGFEQVATQLRVHALGSSVNASNTITVKLAADGYPYDDPGTDFGGMTLAAQPSTTGTDKGAVANSIVLNNTSTAPSYLVSSNQTPGNFGGLLQVYLDVVTGINAVTAFTTKISIDLSLKTTGVIQRPMRASFLGYGGRGIL